MIITPISLYPFLSSFDLRLKALIAFTSATITLELEPNTHELITLPQKYPTFSCILNMCYKT